MPDRDTWLITGASGRLGHRLCAALSAGGRRVVGLCLTHPVDISGVVERQLDLTDAASVQSAIEEIAPRFIVHTAGLTDVDSCEAGPDFAHRIHVGTTATIAAATVGAKIVHISTDHLWNGNRAMVDENTPPTPVNVYARTKLEAEHAVLVRTDALVLRTNFFGRGRPWRPSFSDWIDAALQAGRELQMFDDVYVTPIEMGLLSNIIIEMAERGASGVFHASGGERLSKFDFAVRLARALGRPTTSIKPVSIKGAGLRAPRPADMSLATGKIAGFLGRPMPDIDASLRNLTGVGETTIATT